MDVLAPWIGMIILILIFLMLDLGVFNRIPHKISAREAFYTSAGWIALSLLFNLFIWYWRGGEQALAFFTGYLLEKMLSLDNMFVFAIMFSFFAIMPRHQHRILFWGILGAIIFRLLLIFIGIKLIETFEWIFYLFGSFLIYSGYKIYGQKKPLEAPKPTLFMWIQKWIPLLENYKGRRFFLYREGKWFATPAFLVLLIVEMSDVTFALDSIPAIFAISLDPFIVFSSNIFAILGLRSLYFLLAHILPRFYFLQHALAVILVFIGAKLMLTHHIHIPVWFSLGVIACILSIAIFASLKRGKTHHT